MEDREAFLGKWEARNLSQAESDELRGRVNVLDELQKLTVSDMRRLYGVEDPKEAEEENRNA